MARLSNSTVNCIKTQDLISLIGENFKVKKLDYVFEDLSGDEEDIKDSRYFILNDTWSNENGVVDRIYELAGNFIHTVYCVSKGKNISDLWQSNINSDEEHFRIYSNPIVSPYLELFDADMIKVDYRLISWLRGLAKYGIKVDEDALKDRYKSYEIETIYTWRNVEKPGLKIVNGKMCETGWVSPCDVTLTSKEIQSIVESITDKSLAERVFAVLMTYDSAGTKQN